MFGLTRLKLNRGKWSVPGVKTLQTHDDDHSDDCDYNDDNNLKENEGGDILLSRAALSKLHFHLQPSLHQHYLSTTTIRGKMKG